MNRLRLHLAAMATTFLFHRDPELSGLWFPHRSAHDGDNANVWELSCSEPSCCPTLDLLQHQRYLDREKMKSGSPETETLTCGDAGKVAL